MQELYTQTYSGGRSVDVSKVLRNTYAMLAVTLAWSAVTAGISMAMNFGFGIGLVCSLGALGLIWFALPRTANSSAGIWVVFGFTGLLGFGLGPTLNHYIALPGGGAIIMQALGGTALVFFALSGYVLSTGKNFSFMGGFLSAGMIVAIVASLGMLVASLFGVNVSIFSVALSAVIVLLMSGMILYTTSEIIHGGETNYLMATASLYLSIYNMFTSLLHILGFMGGDE